MIYKVKFGDHPLGKLLFDIITDFLSEKHDFCWSLKSAALDILSSKLGTISFQQSMTSQLGIICPDYPSYNSNLRLHTYLENEESVKLLGMKIDKNLDFPAHIPCLLKEGSQKFHTLMRISKYITDKDKLKLTMRTFIESQFNYCPLIWMCHSRELNRKINKLHERSLRIMYKKVA